MHHEEERIAHVERRRCVPTVSTEVSLPSPDMVWTVIVNPVAGRGRTRKLLPAIEERAAGLGAKVHVSLSPDDPVRLARDAAGQGHDLVACGGDGIAAAVAGVAADTGRGARGGPHRGGQRLRAGDSATTPSIRSTRSTRSSTATTGSSTSGASTDAGTRA